MFSLVAPGHSSQPEFSRWSNRAEIPFWHFEVPDSTAIEAFLERETKSGAVNQARRLVDDLRLSRSEIEEEKLVEDLFALKTEHDENFGAHPLAEQGIKSDGVVVAIKGESPIKIAGPAIQLDRATSASEANPETDSNSSPSSKYTLTKMLRLVIGYLAYISLPLRYLLFGVTKLNWIVMKTFWLTNLKRSSPTLSSRKREK